MAPLFFWVAASIGLLGFLLLAGIALLVWAIPDEMFRSDGAGVNDEPTGPRPDQAGQPQRAD
jgi:hypothetical protein